MNEKQSSKFKYVIIGNCAAGISAVETIRQNDKSSSVAVISDEAHPAYARCLLPNYIEGKLKRESLPIRPDNFYSSLGVEAILGKKVVGLSEGNKALALDDNSTIEFEKLLIATGASPAIPQIDGINKEGVLGLRTMADAERILRMLPGVDTAVVLGGGLVGTKAAYCLRNAGKKAIIVVKSPHILSQMCDARSAGIMSGEMERNGIEISTQTDVVRVEGQNKIKSVVLDNGKTVECQLLIVAKGVAPNTSFLKGSSVKVERGIVVDRKMRTSAPSIYAAGDCAQAYDLLSERTQTHAMWPNAVKQARLAARNMMGEEVLFEGAVGLNSLDYYGLPMVSAGWFKPEGEARLPARQGYEEIIAELPSRRIYKKILLRNNRIAGFILVNDVEKAGLYLSLLRQKVDVSRVKDELLGDKFSYAAAMDYLVDEEKSPTAERARKVAESLIYAAAFGK